MLIPYCVRYIPLRLRQIAAPWVPHAGIQKLRHLTLILGQQSKQIYLDQKAAVEKGDQTAIHQVKEGRDILSVLSTATFNTPLIILCSLVLSLSESEHGSLRRRQIARR